MKYVIQGFTYAVVGCIVSAAMLYATMLALTLLISAIHLGV